jgi:hypothetical protein
MYDPPAAEFRGRSPARRPFERNRPAAHAYMGGTWELLSRWILR